MSKKKKKILKKFKETHLAAVEKPLSICSHLLHCSSFTSLITWTTVMGRWPAGIFCPSSLSWLPLSQKSYQQRPCNFTQKNDVIIAVMIYKLPACQALCWKQLTPVSHLNNLWDKYHSYLHFTKGEMKLFRHKANRVAEPGLSPRAP